MIKRVNHERALVRPLSALLVLAVVLLVGCTAAPAASPNTVTTAAAPAQILKNITPGEAAALLQARQNSPSFVILDVRTPEEYTAGHLDNAVNLDYYAPDFQNNLDRLDKTQVYLVYCSSGNRSAKALEIMERLNFAEVYNMLGGIKAWQEMQGIPTVSVPPM